MTHDERSYSSTSFVVVGIAVIVSCFYLWIRRKKGRGAGTTSNGVKENSSAAPKGSPSTVKSPSNGGRKETAPVYFGSQTGTAESFAKDLARRMTEEGLDAEAVDLEDFAPDAFLNHSFAVFVVATFGEGDPTDNAVSCHKWLSSKHREDGCLAGKRFAVMGLGNRQYLKFNEMGIRTAHHLKRLGGTLICEVGLGDDDQDIEEDFNKWVASEFLPNIKGTGAENAPAVAEPPAAKRKKIHSAKAPLDLVVEGTPCWDGAIEAMSKKKIVGTDIPARSYFAALDAPVKQKVELRQIANADEGLTTCHLEIDLGERVEYVTADTADIIPENDAELVDWFLDRLHVQRGCRKGQPVEADHPFEEDLISFVCLSGTADSGKRPFPTPCSAKVALTRYCDLQHLPQKTCLKSLAEYIEDPKEKAACDALLSDSGVKDFRNHVRQPEVSLKEFLELFMTSANFHLDAFLQLVPRQRPRPYTISSSNELDSTALTVTVSAVNHELPSLRGNLAELQKQGNVPLLSSETVEEIGARQRRFQGVCSRYLCQSVSVGTSVRFLIKTSSFKLVKEPAVPVIMVAAGTGVAPFRGFLQELSIGERRRAALFFGCRRENEDWIYKEEMQKAAACPASGAPVLTHLVTAFSRETDKKVYVQDRLLERKEEMYQWIRDGAHIYICGSTALGHGVQQTINSIGEDFDQSDLVTTLLEEGRFVEELWG